MKVRLLFVAFVLLVSACKKNESTVPSISSTPAMSGKIDGADWTASSLNASINYYSTTQLNVVGWMQSQDQTVYLQLRNYENKPGKYQVSGTGYDVTTAWYQKGHQEIYWSKIGNVTIVNVLPGLVQGTYDFTTTNNIHIVGSFTVAPFIGNL